MLPLRGLRAACGVQPRQFRGGLQPRLRGNGPGPPGRSCHGLRGRRGPEGDWTVVDPAEAWPDFRRQRAWGGGHPAVQGMGVGGFPGGSGGGWSRPWDLMLRTGLDSALGAPTIPTPLRLAGALLLCGGPGPGWRVQRLVQGPCLRGAGGFVRRTLVVRGTGQGRGAGTIVGALLPLQAASRPISLRSWSIVAAPR